MNSVSRDVPELSDPLGETLHQLRLHGSLYCRSELTAPWGIGMPAMPNNMMFHVVTRGVCILEVPGEAPVLMRQGSLALVPRGEGHVVRCTGGSDVVNLFDLPVETVSERYEILRHGGEGELTQLTCGVVKIDHVASERLISLLPPVLLLDSWDSVSDSWLQSTLRFIAQEANEPRPGGETILTHLADILVIYAIRTWLESVPDKQEGWLAAMRDRQIGRALAAIHKAPGNPWNVESLAAECSMSRSGFSARFTKLVGEPAKEYVTRWRMQLAKRRLLTEPVSLATLAEELGYGSEAAFSRAFKRIHGHAPAFTTVARPD